MNEQESGITRMLANMHEQFSSLKARYAIEIRNIEQAFLQERGVGLEKNMEEIESLFEKRKKAELHYKDAKQSREEQYVIVERDRKRAISPEFRVAYCPTSHQQCHRYAEEIESMRRTDAENFNTLKIRLETDVQTLNQQLEEMRATYQLNYEKLEYSEFSRLRQSSFFQKAYL